jgi:hypothetical protein
MAYTVVAIHQGSDSRARQVFAAFRARLKSGDLGSTSVPYTAHAPAVVDGPIAAVYLAGRRAATDTVLLAWPQDLRRLDASRREHAEGGAIPQGHLVYESTDLDPAPGDLLAWIVADRGLSTTLIHAVTGVVETP